MSVDKTTILGLIKRDANGLIESQDVNALIVLDEGFDRPSWGFANATADSRRLVPEEPSTILLDGLLLLASETRSDVDAFRTLNDLCGEKSKIIDLNKNSPDSELRELIPNALAGFEVLVVGLKGSSVLNQIPSIQGLGLQVRVVAEVSF